MSCKSGWQDGAEDYLVHLFKPVWDNEGGICYGLGKLATIPGTRSNLRSPWDTLQHGRGWAHRDEKMPDARPREQILGNLARHFSTVTVYQNLEPGMSGFMDELRRL